MKKKKTKVIYKNNINCLMNKIPYFKKSSVNNVLNLNLIGIKYLFYYYFFN